MEKHRDYCGEGMPTHVKKTLEKAYTQIVTLQ